MKKSKEAVNKISIAFHMYKGGYLEEIRDTKEQKSQQKGKIHLISKNILYSKKSVKNEAYVADGNFFQLFIHFLKEIKFKTPSRSFSSWINPWIC